MVAAYNTRWWKLIKRNLSLAAYPLARKTYLHRSKEKWISSKLAEFMASLTASYCLTLAALKSMFLYSIWALKLARQRIRFPVLSPSFHWNRFSFRRSGSHLVSWRSKSLHWCPITFQPGLKYLEKGIIVSLCVFLLNLRYSSKYFAQIYKALNWDLRGTTTWRPEHS